MIWFPVILFWALIAGSCFLFPREKRFSILFFRSLISVLVAFAAAFIYKFISVPVPSGFSAGAIFRHYLLYDHLFLYIPAALFTLFCILGDRKENFTGILLRGFVFMAVFMFVLLLGKYYYSPHGEWADPYLTFILPFSMLIQCAVFALFIACFFKGNLPVKLISPVLMAAAPFETAAVSFLYYSYHRLQSVILLSGLCIVFAGIFLAAAFRQEKND